MAAAVSFMPAQAGVVIHAWENITFVFGLLWAALLYPPALTVASAGLHYSARASQCCRRRHIHALAWKNCFEACRKPISDQKKKAARCQVSTDQVKGGQKHACIRNIKQVPVFLNKDPISTSRKAWWAPAHAARVLLPIHSSHGSERGLEMGGADEPRAEFGSKACRVPNWYLPASDMLFYAK